MRKELESKLYSAFPDLYARLQYKQIECHDGWYNIIYRLSTNIANIVSESENMDPKAYTVYQVKEKWGALRIYMNKSSTEIQQAIDKAQKESLSTCETCGGEGTLLENGFCRTTCERCEAEYVETQKRWRELGARHLEADSDA